VFLLKAGLSRWWACVATWLGFALLLSTSLLAAPAAANTQLVLVEQEGCHYCEKWLAEIGDRYANTEEGHIAPLRRVWLEQALPDDLPKSMSDVTLTPTFVLVHDGEEIDRLVGYAGDNFFWGQLHTMLNKIPK